MAYRENNNVVSNNIINNRNRHSKIKEYKIQTNGNKSDVKSLRNQHCLNNICETTG